MFRDKLSTGGAVNAIVACLGAFPDDIQLCTNCVQAIIRLCMTESSNSKLRSSAQLYGAIVYSLANHRDKASQCAIALSTATATANATGTATSESDITIQQLLQQQIFLLQQCLLAISQLSSKHEQCRSKFIATEGCGEIIIRVIMTFLADSTISLHGCAAISSLAGGNDHATASSNAVTILTATNAFSPSASSSSSPVPSLSNNSNNSSTSSSSSSSSSTSDLIAICESLGIIGACAAVIGVLNEHRECSQEVTIAACMAIHTLCASPNNRTRFNSIGGCDAIMQTLNKYSNFPTTSQGNSSSAYISALLAVSCNALGSLALAENVDTSLSSSISSFNTTNQDNFGNNGACEVVTDLLIRYGENVTICEAACRSIAHLSFYNIKNQNRFADSSCNEAVVSSLRRHIYSVSGTIQSCLAIACLANEHMENCNALGKQSVAKEIVAVWKKYGTNDGAVEACCRAIFALHPLNEDFANTGICPLIVPALMLHLSNEVVAQWICKVLTSLGRLDSNKLALYKEGVCEAITASLQRHVGNETLLSVMLMRNTSSAGVAQWGCDAMFSMAFMLIEPTSNDYFTANNSNNNSNNNSSSIISNSSNTSNSKIIEDYQKRFISAGACEAVAKALVKYSEVEQVSQACCRAVYILTYGNDGARSRMGGLGVCTSIIDSLHLFPASAQIAQWGCAAVSSLADGDNEANINRFAIAGACETLPVAMQAHQNSPNVAEYGCAAIANLTSRSLYQRNRSNERAASSGNAVVGVVGWLSSPNLILHFCSIY